MHKIKFDLCLIPPSKCSVSIYLISNQDFTSFVTAPPQRGFRLKTVNLVTAVLSVGSLSQIHHDIKSINLISAGLGLFCIITRMISPGPNRILPVRSWRCVVLIRADFSLVSSCWVFWKITSCSSSWSWQTPTNQKSRSRCKLARKLTSRFLWGRKEDLK